MKIKKALSIFLAALMLFTMIPMSVFAESRSAGGHYFSYAAGDSGLVLNIDVDKPLTRGDMYTLLRKHYDIEPNEGRVYKGYYCSTGSVPETAEIHVYKNDENAGESVTLTDNTEYKVWVSKKASITDWSFTKALDSFTTCFYSTAAKDSKLEKKTGVLEVPYIIGEDKATTEAKIFAAVIDTAKSIPAGLTVNDVTITYKTAVAGYADKWEALDYVDDGILKLYPSFAKDFTYESGKTETVRISLKEGYEGYNTSFVEAEIKLIDGRAKYTPVVADIPALTTKQDVDAAIKAAFSIPGLTADDYTFSYECSPAIKDLPVNEATDVTVTYTAALKDTTYKTHTTATVTKAVNITNEVAHATINVTQNAGGTVTVNGETGSSVHAFKGEVTVVATPDAGYYVSAVEGAELKYGDNRSVTYTFNVENEGNYTVNVTFAKSGLVKNEGVLEIPFIIGQSKETSEKAIFDAVVNSGASIPAGLTVNDVKIEYKSLSQPNKQPAAVYINKFIPISNSPTETILSLFESTIDNISVPSNDALFLRIKPTPRPNKIPPNTVAKSKSFVAGFKLTAMFVAKESIAVATKVFAINFLPNALKAISIKGMFMQKIKRPRFHLVIYETIMEIPITPPSIILLGSKNISKATATIKAPSNQKKDFFKYSKAISFLVFTLISGFFFLVKNTEPYFPRNLSKIFLCLTSTSAGFIPKIDSKSAFNVVKSSYFFNIPSIQIETSPVSSETTRQAASETSDIPNAAL